MQKRLQGLGVTLTVEQIQARNVAVVMVTGNLPVTARPGQRIDVEVSSAGDALSLEGGVLQLTPLLAADGEAYGIAQGPLVLGGFSVEQSGSVSRKNHTTTGRIPQGGIVEKKMPIDWSYRHSCRSIIFCGNLILQQHYVWSKLLMESWVKELL